MNDNQEFLLSHVVNLYRLLTRPRSRDDKVRDLQDFIKDWRATGKDIYDVYRLLLPKVLPFKKSNFKKYDSHRTIYGIKETTMAKLYIDLLQLSPSSLDARKLLGYKDPGLNGTSAGDFVSVLDGVLKNRKSQKQSSNLTIEDANRLLDELYQASDQYALKQYLFNPFIGRQRNKFSSRFLNCVLRANKPFWLE